MNLKKEVLKLKRGGLDTIVAYIVVMIPLFYVLIYMVATIYHFSVQMYMGQVAKEAAVMASTYGDIAGAHLDYINSKLCNPDKPVVRGGCNVTFYVRKFDPSSGVVSNSTVAVEPSATYEAKGDIIGVYIESVNDSVLDKVTAAGIFSSGSLSHLKYSAYREEIIRNERKP